MLQRLQTADAWQQDIQQHQVKRSTAGQAQTLATILAKADVIAACLQVAPHVTGQQGIIFNQKNARGRK